MRESFTGRIREAAKRLGERQSRFTSEDVAHEAGLRTSEERARMRARIVDLVNAGYLARVDKGIYAWIGGAERKPRKQEIMWRFLRMRRSVTIEDLVLATDAGADWAQEWVLGLVNLGVVRNHGNGTYRLIKDTLKMPPNEAKAKKLRAARANETTGPGAAQAHQGGRGYGGADHGGTGGTGREGGNAWRGGVAVATRVARSDARIDEVIDLCEELIEGDTLYPYRSYEQGVLYAIRWIVGASDSHPFKNDEDFVD